jgi:hypothetical protein
VAASAVLTAAGNPWVVHLLVDDVRLASFTDRIYRFSGHFCPYGDHKRPLKHEPTVKSSLFAPGRSKMSV